MMLRRMGGSESQQAARILRYVCQHKVCKFINFYTITIKDSEVADSVILNLNTSRRSMVNFSLRPL
jgi:hypothetical protein